MVGIKFTLSALLLAVAAVVQADNTQLQTTTPQPDSTTKSTSPDVAVTPQGPQFPACDASLDDRTLRTTGITKIWQHSNDKNFFLTPGQSACGANYTDFANVVCLSPGWTTYATVPKAGCDKWVTIFNPDSGVVTQARVLDSCGAEVNTTFGCNDIYLSKRVFEQLAGRDRKAAIEAGSLPESVMWVFSVQPCWACWAGLPGRLPDGSRDNCTQQDNMGFTRCGRKGRGERVVGAGSAFVCNQQVDTCEKAMDIFPQIPKIANSTKIPASTPMGQAPSLQDDTTKKSPGSGPKPVSTENTPTTTPDTKQTDGMTKTDSKKKMEPLMTGGTKKDANTPSPRDTNPDLANSYRKREPSHFEKRSQKASST